MNGTILDARTVAIVRDLQVEQKTGANGTFEAKSILFRIAVDRPYKVTRQENGKTISENPTDFWLAKATGNTAQAINDYCTAKKEDGKLVSRRLLLSGNFENYNSPRTVSDTVQVNIGGQLYNINVELPVKNNKETIFIVNEMKFLDSNPQNANGAKPASATATVTGVAQPVGGQPVQAQPAGAVAQPQAQGTQNAVPAQPVQAQTATAQPVANTNPVEGAMNPPTPTVGEGFVPEGQTAPF